MQVQPGTLQVRVVKQISARRVRVFEQEMRIGDGIVKRIDVVLGTPELTPTREIVAEYLVARILQGM